MILTKNLLLAILLTLTVNSVYTQHWLEKAGGTANDEAYDVEVDDAGNIYTVGYVSGPVTFGDDIILTANGYSDIYISKSNADGVFLWVKIFGGNLSDRATDVDVGADGSLYITGYFQGTATFDSFTLTSNSDSRDFFVAKLNNSGDVIWVVGEGGDSGEIGSCVSVGSDNSVVVTGEFSGSTNIGGNTFQSAYDDVADEYSKDIFVVKYNSLGNPLWSIQGSSDKNDRGLRVDVANNNDIYLTGQVSDTMVFAGQTVNNAILNAGYIAKLNPLGSVEWINILSAYEVNAYDLEIDDDRIYITGEYLGQMLILTDPIVTLGGNYTYKLFLIRFDTDGQVVWGEEDDSDSKISSKALCIDSNRDIYIAGIFKCRFDEYADALGGEGYFYSAGYRDVFITKYESNGNRVWFRQYGGTSNDWCFGIAISDIDNPIIAGGFEKSFFAPQTFNYEISNESFAESIGCNGDINIFAGIESSDNLDILVATPFVSDAPNFFYFDNGCYDVALPEIYPDLDSLSLCNPTTVTVNTNTYFYSEDYDLSSGPEYNYQWSNGSITALTEIMTSGDYFVEVTRKDLCYSGYDSIHIDINPVPSMPWMTDDAGYNTNEYPSYNNITTCGEEVLVILENDTTEGITTVASPVSDPFLYTDGGYTMTESGLYEIFIINEFGCYNSANYNLIFESAPTIPLIDPILLNTLGQDSITICQGEGITFAIFDQISNPNLVLDSPYCDGPIYPTGSSTCIESTVYPTSDGWYYLSNFGFELGYDNICGDESTEYLVNSDSVYVTVNPNPMVSITIDSDPYLCPGDTINAWINNTVENFSWSGSGIVSTSENGDTISVISTGQYYYGGTLVDSLTGCSVSLSTNIGIYAPPSPTITSNVMDNVVCPNDSILLTCNANQSYAWVGPDGDDLGSTQSIWIDQPGYYYCVAVNFIGCTLTSNTIETLEYTSPFVIISPTGDICTSGSVTLSTIVTGSPDLWWDAPINSTQPEVTVYEMGEYTVTVEQCNIEFTQTIVIDDNSFVANIEITPDVTACVGDTIELTANADMIFYDWSNGMTSESILVTESGTYDVNLINPYGCEDVSDQITITFLQESPEPAGLDTSICSGSDIILTSEYASGSVWYDANNNELAQGDTYILNNVISPIQIQVSNVLGSCVSETSLISINTHPSPEIPIISLPDTICEQDVLEVLFTNWSDEISSWDGEVGTSNGDIYTVLLIDSLISLTAININSFDCSVITVVDIVPNPLPNAPLLLYNYPLCDDDSLTLEGFSNQTNINYNWQDPQGNNMPEEMWNYGVVTTENTGDYTLTIENENGCHITDTLEVIIHSYPILELDLDTNFCFENELIIQVEEPYQTYEWNEGTIGNTITIEEPGQYVLEVSTNSCFVTDTITVTSIGCPIPGFANVFTPNEDGVNDLFFFSHALIRDMKARIYNRWGTIVSEIDSDVQYWDGTNSFTGKPLSDGTYFYIANFENFQGIWKKRSGYITLRR